MLVARDVCEFLDLVDHYRLWGTPTERRELWLRAENNPQWRALLTALLGPEDQPAEWVGREG